MWSKVLKFLLWASPSLLVAGATWGLVAILTNGYHDSTHRWTAVATIFAGSALAVAVIGLPFAVYQLMQINRGLTRRSELRKKVTEHRLAGRKVLANIRNHPVTSEIYGQLSGEAAEWADAVAKFLRDELRDEAEEADFRQCGEDSEPIPQLEAKLNWLRNDLLPKIVAGGYW